MPSPLTSVTTMDAVEDEYGTPVLTGSESASPVERHRCQLALPSWGPTISS